jgi:CheY-like chemotaxis protein
MIEKNIKLLVVDDNVQIRNLIVLSFKRQPKEVFEAENGVEAFK